MPLAAGIAIAIGLVDQRGYRNRGVATRSGAIPRNSVTRAANPFGSLSRPARTIRGPFEDALTGGQRLFVLPGVIAVAASLRVRYSMIFPLARIAPLPVSDHPLASWDLQAIAHVNRDRFGTIDDGERLWFSGVFDPVERTDRVAPQEVIAVLGIGVCITEPCHLEGGRGIRTAVGMTAQAGQGITAIVNQRITPRAWSSVIPVSTV